MPSSLSYVEAASVPVIAVTAWQGLFDQARLEAEPQGTSEPTRFSSLVARSPALHRDGGDQRHRLRPKADISALVLLRSGA